MKKPFNWKIFFILLVASIVGVVAVLPYTLALQSSSLAKLELPIPFWLLITLQVLQNTVLFAVVILLGLLAANKVGLGLPSLEAKLRGESIRQQIKAILLPSILLGVIGSVLVVVLDVWVFSPLLTAEMGDKAMALSLSSQPAAWMGLLASFCGGINEELMLRLGLMSNPCLAGTFRQR